MQIGVLGPAMATVDGVEQDVGAAKQRALLAVLALHRRESVSTTTIVEALWGEHPPVSDTVTLQGYVYALRKVLEPHRAPRQPAQILVTTHAGYALQVPDDALDVGRLEAAVRGASALVLVSNERPWHVDPAVSTSDLHRAAAALDTALADWRGEPFTELADFGGAVAERVRLAELRVTAQELRAGLALASGEASDAAALLDTVTLQQPHRERPWLLRAVALVRTGRQVEALDVLRVLREHLRDELGIDPSQNVRELETAILQQDASLVSPVQAAPRVVKVEVSAEPDAWPLVGRQDERARLETVLDLADAGTPQLVQLIGDPGIGKSRLARDFRNRASERGYVCAEAFCSQDEGAPPLWPWIALLSALGRQTGVAVPDLQGTEGSQFALWESIAAAICASVADHPVLLTIDDTHWADPSTLRALRHLIDVTARGRLVIVMTRRSFPAPVDAQAALADALARRHCVRLELEGLDAVASSELLNAVTDEPRSAADLRRLLERTEGNPFFLIELARAGEAVPGSVRDVVARRVGELPLGSRDLLAMAAVLGRRFRLDAVGAAAGIGPDEVIERLLPAMDVGLVIDSDPDTPHGVAAARFSHPLVQDVVVDRIPRIHRAGLHAAAAQALTTLRDVPPGDLARHWRNGGPQYASQCVESALLAAEQAREVAAYEEELELLGWAVQAYAVLPETDDRALYDLEMARARAARWSGQWAAAEESVAAAVALADRLGDHEALARAALSTVEGAVWYSNSFGEINAFIVDTLERVLQGLPKHDSELRCRVLLSLGIELYFSADADRVGAYIDDAVDMARRLDDPRLLQSVLHGACYGNWRPGSTVYRVELAREAVALADSTGDERALALALAALASALAEMGRIDEMWPAVQRGLEVAAVHNLTAVTVFLEAMRLPWIVLSGDEDRSRDVLPRLRELAARVAIPNVAAALAHTALVTGLTDEGSGADDERVLELAAVPTASAHAVVCARRGDLDTARQIIAANQQRFVADHHDFMSMMRWCYGAELALVLGDVDMATELDEALAPYGGRSCSAAQIGADGPVDVYRALAAAAMGDIDRATRLADVALRQCEAWNVPRAAERLAGYRSTHGF